MKLKSKESPREEKTELKRQPLFRVKSNIKAGVDVAELGHCVLDSVTVDGTKVLRIACNPDVTCQK